MAYPLKPASVIVPRESPAIKWVIIILTVVIIIGIVLATAILYALDKWPYGPVQPSDPKFKYPDGKYPGKKNVALSAEATDNINKNVAALKKAEAKQ